MVSKPKNGLVTADPYSQICHFLCKVSRNLFTHMVRKHFLYWAVGIHKMLNTYIFWCKCQQLITFGCGGGNVHRTQVSCTTFWCELAIVIGLFGIFQYTATFL